MKLVRLIVFLLIPGIHAAPVDARGVTDTLVVHTVRDRLRQFSPSQQEDIVWLARCMYSESNQADEQRLVGWVVRNRVETRFRGDSYRGVVLEPYQFTAFNEPTDRRNHILNLTAESPYEPWQKTLETALDVYTASEEERPFSRTTRHFYSPVSMPDHQAPDWAAGKVSVELSRLGIDGDRFRFFDSVDDSTFVPAQKPAAEELVQAGSERTIERLRERLHKKVAFSGRVKRPSRPRVERPGTQKGDEPVVTGTQMQSITDRR